VVPLEANFSTNTTSGNAPLVIEFTDLSQNVDSRSWDFNNDGTPDSDKEKIVYTYATPGTYTAKLTVTKANETASKTATINVTKAPTNNGESGGKSSHSSGGSGRSGGSIGPVVSSTVTSTGKSNATGNATVTQAQNNTPIEQNNENTVVDVEQTPVQTNNTSTPAKESKKTPAFGIISGIICLSAVFLYKRR
jgi:PKD repeat protein